MAARRALRGPLAEFLRSSSTGDIAAAMLIFRNSRAEMSAEQMIGALYGLEASAILKGAYVAHGHHVAPALKAMGERVAEERLQAAGEIAKALEHQHPALSADHRAQSATALMHVHTTCGYHAAKRVPQMYADLGAAGLRPTLATLLVTGRALLLLRQHQTLEALIDRLRRLHANLPLPFYHLLLDQRNDEGDYAAAYDLFHNVVRQYQTATPYLFDAHWRTCQRVDPPRRHVARLQRLMYSSNVLPHDVAPVTWLGIQAAVDSEVAERERAYTRQPTIARMMQKGGVFRPQDFDGLLTDRLRAKLKTGKYDAEGKARWFETRPPLPRSVAPLPPGWGN